MVENNGGKSSASAKAVAFCSAKQGGLIMGIIRAITQAIGGGLADQWLEVYEADDMGDIRSATVRSFMCMTISS